MVTALYASILGILLFCLSAVVVVMRWRSRTSLGIGKERSQDSHHSFLERAIRTQGNFIEYVPLTLLLLFLLEVHFFSFKYLHVIGGMLLIGRILHAIGLYCYAGTSIWRFLGALLTFLSLLTASISLLVTRWLFF